MSSARLNVRRGTALYVGALLGPGLLLVPSLAVRAAGPASVIAWAGLIVLSAPLAVTFATLGVRHPVAGGVSVYVREGFGDAAAAVTGACFLAATIVGGPAVALVGGSYVADLAGAGAGTAVAVAAALFGAVLLANAFGLRVSSGLQLALAAVLVGVIALAVGLVLPSRAGDHWSPFAPNGPWSIGTAANLLVWHFIGWEAMAQMAGDFRDPRRDMPRAVALAFATIAVLYVGIAVATVAVSAPRTSKVPLADLLGAGLGEMGRGATVPLAVALTMGTMNVYFGGTAKLAADLAREAALPAWLAGGGGGGDVPRRPLAVLAVLGSGMLAALASGAIGAEGLVRATSACFLAVYVLTLGSSVRILAGWARATALAALGLVLSIAAFSGPYALAPALAAAVALLTRALTRRTPRPRRRSRRPR